MKKRRNAIAQQSGGFRTGEQVGSIAFMSLRRSDVQEEAGDSGCVEEITHYV